MLNWTWRTFGLLLALALSVWLWPSIFGGKVLLPLDLVSHNPPHEASTAEQVHNGLIGDVIYENYTWKLFQRQALTAGELPLWNPYTFGGHPLYATGQASTFYPLNAIFWIVPLPYAYVVFTWLHLWLGGLFMYWFCRRMGVGGFGAAAGGMVFALGGFLTARLVFPMLLGSAIWLPLMLAWIDWMAGSAQLTRKTRGLAVGALLFAQPLLAGFVEIAFYAYVACLLFVVFRAITLARQRYMETKGQSYRETAGLANDQQATIHEQSTIGCVVAFSVKVAAVWSLAMLLSAPQLLPFFEVIHRNIRAGQGGYGTVKANALAPAELLTVVSPDALGNPAKHESFSLSNRLWRAGGPYYFGPKNYVEAGFYFGLLPLGFLLLSLAGRNRGRGFAWMLLVLAVAMALVTPIYQLFYYLVPGAEQVRTPFRWMYLALFAGAFLAAIGGQYWYERLQRPGGRFGRLLTALAQIVGLILAVGVFGLLVWPGPLMNLAQGLIEQKTRIGTAFTNADDLAGFLWWNGFRLVGFALAAAICLALGWWRGWSPRAAGWLSLVAMVILTADLAQASYGFYTHSDPGILNRKSPIIRHMESDSGVFRFGRFGPDKYLYSNLSTLYRLQDFGGYDSIILKDYVTFLNAIENQHLVKYNIVMTLEQARSLDSPLLPLLNMRYLLTAKEFDHPDWRKVPAPGNVNLYRVRPERELPRVFMVGSVQAVGSLREAIDHIKGKRVDVFKAATVEASPEQVAALVDVPADGAGTANITSYRFSSVSVDTSAPGREFLVLLDVDYPGWNAYVDGRRAEVYRTDGVFRGVSVPAGRHQVEFRFEPRSFRVGVLACGASLLLILVFGIAGVSGARGGCRL